MAIDKAFIALSCFKLTHPGKKIFLIPKSFDSNAFLRSPSPQIINSKSKFLIFGVNRAETRSSKL